MNFNPRHFLRMARWARNPPSENRVLLAIGVIVLCLGLWAVEKWVGWPDWLITNEIPRGRLSR